MTVKQGRLPMNPIERAALELIDASGFVDPHTEPPARLDESGQRVWREVLPMIHGRLRSKDLRCLEGYCLAWQTYYQLADARNGEVMIYTERGMMVHPLISAENQALTQVAAYQKRLGMEPTFTGHAPAAPDDGTPTADSILKLRRG